VFGETRGHERRRFFVANRNEANPILTLAERLDDRIDAIADNAESMGGTPSDQRFDNDVGGI
jgi:hypothetical protein